MECYREERESKTVATFEMYSDEGCTTLIESVGFTQTGDSGKCFHTYFEEGDEHGMQLVCKEGKANLMFYTDSKCTKPSTEEGGGFFDLVTAEDAHLFMTAGKCLKQPAAMCHPDDAPCNTWAKLKAPVSADWGQGCATAATGGAPAPAATGDAPGDTGASASGAMLQSMIVSLGLVLALLWQI
eukprot:gnl/MRDRNA2_/MRDRNA2_28283_c0_seq1.p1 gnl/MRDRNA2_/MRDRNA2_28283_c0~~gnl/MRDRNA2_/MRDRNA2_28283_c0_seq1.p1  ORF type:complete len:204 (+),score=40.68 gnl/MRDRNA2_/MRDRNA2_28283_c0_seq1:62-613(+)